MTSLVPHPLTYVRQELGWSMDDLARLLHRAARRVNQRSGTDRNRIWKWESGRTVPNLDSQYLLASVLRVPRGTVTALGWPQWLPAHGRTHAFTAAGGRAALMEVTVAQSDRRAFLILSGAALVGLSQQWARVEPERLDGALAGRRIDAELLRWLEARAGELRALTNTAEPLVADLVDAHLSAAIRLIDQGAYTAEAGRRLYAVTAALAQCAGWLRFDQARHGSAQRHWQAALHASHAASDRDLGAGILSDLAYQATWLGHPAQAADILTWAATRTSAPAARSLLDLRRARALALSADAPGCGRALAAAERELDRAGNSPAPGWVSWMSPADLAADAGRCWLDLGRLDRARASIEDGLRWLDPARGRTRSVFLVYQATAALRGHDVPAAVAHGRAAVDTAVEAASTRCVDLVRTLLDGFAPHRQAAEVRDLDDYAHAVLGG